ncbi:MAG: site-2 protease family protein [Desulfurococcaceae archaeon]|nr:site-2 protease family protein [Desulfurococcaceae archaeon]
MNDLQTILIVFGLFIAITTVLSLNTRTNSIVIKNRYRVQFIVGGILVFLGKSRKPVNSKPLGKGFSYGLYSSVVIGITLFYVMLFPRLIGFIREFLRHIMGSAPAPQPVVVPLPLVFKSSQFLPYPVAYIIIALVIAIVLHELAHAVVALKEGVSVKSWGLGVLLLIPVAFVELDDVELNTASTKSKLNIVSAGIFANALASAIFLIVMISSVFFANHFLGNPIQAVMISDIDCSICNTSICPAKLANIEPNSIILSINNTVITSLNQFISIIRSASIGSNLSLYLCKSDLCWNKSLYLFAHRIDNPATPCIGAVFNSVTAFVKDSKVYVAQWFENLVLMLESITNINLSLFALNAIPLFITDGSLFIKLILETRGSRFNKILNLKIIDIVNSLIIAITMVIASYIILTYG